MRIKFYDINGNHHIIYVDTIIEVVKTPSGACIVHLTNGKSVNATITIEEMYQKIKYAKSTVRR